MSLTMLQMLDHDGFMGAVIGCCLTAFFCGSSLLLFVYFYFKGSLGFDDEAAKQMLSEEESAGEL